MAPIEIFFGIVVFMFMMIGVVRGFLRELGVTLVMVFLLFFLHQFDSQLNEGLTKAFTVSRKVLPMPSVEKVECLLFVFVVSAMAFISYQGETLTFQGSPPKGTSGIYLGLLTGALNGYLIAGSIWYYMDKFDYSCGLFAPQNFSHFAKEFIQFLPMNLLGEPILFGQSLLLYLAALLVLARVIR